MTELKNGFNFANVSDENENLQSKQGGKFGLNTECHFTTIEFITNAGKDETEGEAVDLNIQVGDREYRRRIYNPEGMNMFDSNSNTVEPGQNGYDKLLNTAMSHATAMIVHAIKAVGVTQEQINAKVTQTQPTTFAAFAQTVISLLPADYKSRPVDVFLQYQWFISDGQTMTFLELPKNMKQKYWVVPSIPGVEWKEIRDVNGLIYVDDKGNKHKIEKTASFLDSNFAKQQNLEAAPAGNIGNSNGVKSDW